MDIFTLACRLTSTKSIFTIAAHEVPVAGGTCSTVDIVKHCCCRGRHTVSWLVWSWEPRQALVANRSIDDSIDGLECALNLQSNKSTM